MKSLISPVAVIIGISSLTSLSLRSQTALPAPAAVAPVTAPADPFSQDAKAKEKAEDAALLQQLDEGQVSSDAGPKPKERWSGRISKGGAVAGVAPVGGAFNVQNLVTRPLNGTSKPLLVRTSEPDPKTQAELEEDLTVMAHILGKALDELPGGRANMKALGIDVFFTPGSSPLRSLYLDNYGALFFFGVNFPLVAPAEKRSDEKATADSDWEGARQELYGQRLQAGELTEEYSQEKVDKLKEKLLEALKNATNIRGLKPDEFVTVWVSGGNSTGANRVRVRKANPGGTPGSIMTIDQPGSLARRTVMTIRVSKAEIDSYSKGKLSLEEFQKHARITTYTGDTGAGLADALVVGGGFGGGRARFRDIEN